MARRSATKETEAPAKKKAGTRLSAEEREKKQQDSAREERGSSLIDSRTKRDIVGVLLIIFAAVLMLCAVLPDRVVGEEGIVTHVAGTVLHLVFGVGCYILPAFLAIIGITFLVRFDLERVPTRVALGLAIIFVALLGFIGTFTVISGANGDGPSLFFSEMAVRAHGGYIGAGLAWAGFMLFGTVICRVILGGIMLIGVLVIGLSLSKLIESIREKRRAHAEAVRETRESGSMALPFARIRRGKGAADDLEEGEVDPLPAPPGVTIDLLSERSHNRQRTSDPMPVNANGPFGSLLQLNPNAAGITMVDAPVGDQTGALTRPLLDEQRACIEEESFQYVPQDELSVPAAQNLVPISYDDVLEPLEHDLEPIGASTQHLEQPEAGTFEALAASLPRIEDIPLDLPEIDPDREAAFASDPTFEPSIDLDAPFDIDIDPSVGADSLEPGPEVITRKLGRAPAYAPSADAAPAEPQPPKKTRKKSSAPRKDRKAVPVVLEPEPIDDGTFRLPPMSLLASSGKKGATVAESELSQTAERLQGTLEDFGIHATVVGWVAGPTVTLYKVDLPSGVRVSRVTALNDDIALALAAPGVRIFAPIPHTNYVGIEVPNQTRQTVLLSDVLEEATEGPLQVAIGKDVEGNAIVSDLAKMPHLLIGGTTGSGKSVSINGMIMSMLMRATPDEVRFIMVDPKRVEFTPYNGIPHLYVPVVTEAKEAASALSWGVAEMERRLKVFAKLGVRNITQYNARVENQGEPEEGEEPLQKMPYIVIIIDELADLMMNVGKEVEFSISRIAQLARAAGIHLIVATQRPSTNVVTGLIKANITNRIAFNVASGIDSRVILDTPGAENLIGLGDLLLSKPELSKPQRIQGCYVSEDEIEAVVAHLKAQGEPEYHSEILKTNIVTLGASSPDGDGGSSSDDPLLWEAADIVVAASMGSTSNIQRRLKVGYARAGRIMDQLEEKGIVGPANGSRPRDVLVDAMELETLKAFEANDEE